MDDAPVCYLCLGPDAAEYALSAFPHDESDVRYQLLPFSSDIALRADGHPCGGAVVRVACKATA